MVRPLGFLVGLGFITALIFAIFTTPLKNEPTPPIVSSSIQGIWSLPATV